jgi:tubulin polyglutamylase TTLL4
MESKLSFAQMKKEYEDEGADFDGTFERIKDVIIKTMLSVENPIVTAMGGTKNKVCSFELYGFDILIDHAFKPWLLEVNVCPSLSSSSPMDKYIKTMLLSDSLYLTGFRMFDRKQMEKDKAKNDKKRLLGLEKQSTRSSQPDQTKDAAAS